MFRNLQFNLSRLMESYSPLLDHHKLCSFLIEKIWNPYFSAAKGKCFEKIIFLIPFFIFIIVEKTRTDLETMENERFQNFSNFHFYPSLSLFFLTISMITLDPSTIIFREYLSFSLAFPPFPLLSPFPLGTSLSSTREKWTFRFIIDSLLSRLFFYLGVIFFFSARHITRAGNKR